MTELILCPLCPLNIALIPNSGKDPCRCGNYRPISLLNVDLKMYSKILEFRLSPLVPIIVHNNRVRFVPGCEARKSRNISSNHVSYRLTQKRHLIGLVGLFSIFIWNKLDWVLITKVMALYSSRSASVLVNCVRLEPFQISNGTRQGCH